MLPCLAGDSDDPDNVALAVSPQTDPVRFGAFDDELVRRLQGPVVNSTTSRAVPLPLMNRHSAAFAEQVIAGAESR